VSVTIFHNPGCSKCRQSLCLLEEQGEDVQIVEYLQSPPSATELKRILSLLQKRPRDILRTHEDEYLQAGLDDMTLSDDDVIEKMIAFPRVIERPIVVHGDKAVIGRPPENVLRLFDGG